MGQLGEKMRLSGKETAGLALAQENTSLRENIRICITQGGLCV